MDRIQDWTDHKSSTIKEMSRVFSLTETRPEPIDFLGDPRRVFYCRQDTDSHVRTRSRDESLRGAQFQNSAAGLVGERSRADQLFRRAGCWLDGRRAGHKGTGSNGANQGTDLLPLHEARQGLGFSLHVGSPLIYPP